VKMGYRRTQEQIEIANRAYNRWLADFISAAPHWFAALAAVSFDDVDAAIAEIVWAKEAGSTLRLSQAAAAQCRVECSMS
jgi:hypothetical protein